MKRGIGLLRADFSQVVQKFDLGQHPDARGLLECLYCDVGYYSIYQITLKSIAVNRLNSPTKAVP